MPDISMCGSDVCPVRETCYRNPASGTKSSEFRQSWFARKFKDSDECMAYWPIHRGER